MATVNGPKMKVGSEFRFDAFGNGEVVFGKKKNHLPAMGWNSWNAFGSGNTEALTKIMADRFIELGLDKLGYEYLVLDDGCYKPERVDGKLSNEEVKFPSGFRALADYIHAKGLKFGMYNDIGTNLCAGAAVGTCGHEETDAASYVEWGVDFLKVDNCYYLWDNATFSDGRNARYVYAPHIKSVRVTGPSFAWEAEAAQGELFGQGAVIKTLSDGSRYVGGIGTFDGTNTGTTPVGIRSSELRFTVGDVPADGEYSLFVTYATAEEPGCGSWLQAAVGNTGEASVLWDDFLPATADKETFTESEAIRITLKKGENLLRLMNHRRQENTLLSYAALIEGLKKADPENDIMFSICEWGKTQPQNWGYKVGDSWRILNDITFWVGSDGNPGMGRWFDPGTPSVTSQYDKAVVMDEFAGLTKGWNDPDMLMIGMNGMTHTMDKTHFTMWCMMNSPLMLGMDLRRVEKGDDMYNIITNEALIALNQDALGVQAKRIYTSVYSEDPSKEYIQEHNRVDVLAKPLSDGSVGLSFINVNDQEMTGDFTVTKEDIVKFIGDRMKDADSFAQATSFKTIDLWTGETVSGASGTFTINKLNGCDNVTIRVYAE